MKKYDFLNDTFVVNDYLHASPFSSFLPAISGVTGKPLWVFYCNRGQGLASFGVTSKETPMTPFDSANSAYQNISLKSFRTFIKANGKFSEAFNKESHDNKMFINKSDFTIFDKEKDYEITITYSTVSEKDYPGLIRKVSVKNNTNSKIKYEIIDGLPIFFPYGLSNFSYKELVSLMAAYCLVINKENKMPFVKFKTSTNDCSIVSEVENGNGFVSIDEQGNRLTNFIDPKTVFGDDLALIKPEGFINNNLETLINTKEQTENKLPCAFSFISKELNPGESLTYYSIYGYFENIIEFKDNLGYIKPIDIENMISRTKEIIDDLLKGFKVSTNKDIFDKYVSQSLLDNNLRGGFPISLTEDGKNPYYIYSRKHGDMERDYNSFIIPSTYYSSGSGNFRDVLQNRRSDIYLYPVVKDTAIKQFFTLIQIDGQNPLNVKPDVFVLDNENLIKKYEFSKDFAKTLRKEFVPSELYTYLKTNHYENIKEVFNDVINNSHTEIRANFAEGYWVDHWTYLVDLLEAYESVNPDKIKELLFNDDYKYFYSLVYVEPRSEKYSLVSENKVRQYGAINLKRLKEECEKLGYDINSTYYLKDKNNNEVKTTLASKIFNLILIKFSTLDSLQLGIEMECEKPGWNDAMNGLPGLFSSGMSETVELLRLTNFLENALSNYQGENLVILKEQAEFYEGTLSLVNSLLTEKIDNFSYWDKETSLREKFREKVHLGVDGEVKTYKVSNILEFLRNVKLILSKGIKKARELYEGILPSYLIYYVKDYEKTGYINHLGYETVKVKRFELYKLVPFLEGAARSFKLGKEFADEKEYRLIKESDLYDKKIHIYKTCAAIDDEPFEIGRIHAFTKGWLERECGFLHMNYKYLLGLLKCGLYKEFYNEIKDNFVCFMDPEIYKRSPIENSSFVVPSCNPDESIHGKGYFARLTGANAELIDMVIYMFIGKHMFTYKDGCLSLSISPKLSKEFFKEGHATLTFYNGLKLDIYNPNLINAYDSNEISYVIDNKEYKEIKGDLAKKVQEGIIKNIEVVVK